MSRPRTQGTHNRTLHQNLLGQLICTLQSVVTYSKLRCRLSRATFPPTNLEEISIEPSIVLAHGIMSETRMRKIIRKTCSKLEGSAPDSSMSFKRFHHWPLEFPNNYSPETFYYVAQRIVGCGRRRLGFHFEIGIDHEG